MSTAQFLVRVEICRDRHDQPSCKICASCVNFPRKQRNFSQNLRRTTKCTHTKCDFALNLLKFYTPSYILTKNLLKWLILMHLRCFFLSKNSLNTHFTKIRSCKFFDKYQVCRCYMLRWSCYNQTNYTLRKFWSLIFGQHSWFRGRSRDDNQIWFIRFRDIPL